MLIRAYYNYINQVIIACYIRFRTKSESE
jgi:hypothetical protein